MQHILRMGHCDVTRLENPNKWSNFIVIMQQWIISFVKQTFHS